ncbi:MarR family winged helix-turn-helix transcriptional regulator [Nocardia mexicana]|uniref:DNA-binding MarR family transcriptional regulator n=1 Tax=Nocardia mexicana TaxID=279262 RepID=A0A370GIQ9_9NOCA|nr:MarR family transcriptional regulator [Nocardia mexicana]RDI43682.1 DNA-binding MarR family transcriptional regulator [Nocardia mexicana]
MDDAPDDLDVDVFATAVENFNRFYIRLPSSERLSFTTLSVLDTLASGTGPMRLSDLVKTEQISQPGLTQLVARLERDGLVERRPDPTDRRAALVDITAAGRRIGAARRADRVEHLRPLFADLSPEERRALSAALPVLHRLAALGRDAQRGA